MKIIYIILFFLDTAVLMALAYVFFRMVDTGQYGWSITFIGSGILVSILLLIYLLLNYIKTPEK
jgi:hypothetical protein